MQHLIISPFPDHYEEHTPTSTGSNIFVRRIRPEDAPLLIGLFESLSAYSVYRLFFTPLERLPQVMHVRFTQIDYDQQKGKNHLHGIKLPTILNYLHPSDNR